MEPIIEIRGVGKKYNITHQRGGYVALRDVFANVLRNPFRFAKHKAKQVVGIATQEDFWALKGVDLQIQKGEAIGIIGKNGSGKSTLLKILTGITPPTEGEIIMRGHTASLLEVGTGFHPELTGRENIFLNGAILGMSQKEIVKKFDAIVAFSGVEKFIDTPVKRYSSGMYVRLAFSVAAHMEPDILLVDEVLAVGDAEFQKKCLGKMEEVTGEAGRTILFVSHNLSAIEKLCPKTIWLDQGVVQRFGPTEEVINEYLGKGSHKNPAILEFPVNEAKDMQISKISLLNAQKQPSSEFDMQAPFTIDVTYVVKNQIDRAMLSIRLFTRDGQMVLNSDPFDYTNALPPPLVPGKYTTRIQVPAHLLNVGEYYLDALLHIPIAAGFDYKKSIQFSIYDSGSLKGEMYNYQYQGILAVPLRHHTTPEKKS